MSARWGCATDRRKWLIFVRLLLSFPLLAASVESTGSVDDQHSTSGLARSLETRIAHQKKISFQDWVQQTKNNYGMFLNHSSFVEGEVLLFRTKKSRYRAIPVMKTSFESSSKFSDALTFKEFIRSWLQRVSGQEKALKVTIRTSEVVRPVLLHLYANKHLFQSPVILHANTFESKHSAERPVDLGLFIKTVNELLPDAVISLGWTPSEDYDAINKLDWTRTFRLLSYIYDLNKPILLTMKLNDAIHSLEPLNWLLGTIRPNVFLILKGDVTDFIDGGDESFDQLVSLAQNEKVFFDVDDSWKRKLADIRKIRKKKRSIEPEKWTNLIFPNPYGTLSGMTVSDAGVAFLGWPNALLVSNISAGEIPSKQKVMGKVLFLPKRHIRDISPTQDTGMLIELFEGDAANLNRPKIEDAIKLFIGYNGAVSIENGLSDNDLTLYHQSTSGQLPPSPCYDFEVLDRGWRVEIEIWTTSCASPLNYRRDDVKDETPQFRTFLQLDTPISKSRKMRSVAIGKTGDGAVDFIIKKLVHSSSIKPLARPLLFIVLLVGAIL